MVIYFVKCVDYVYGLLIDIKDAVDASDYRNRFDIIGPLLLDDGEGTLVPDDVHLW